MLADHVKFLRLSSCPARASCTLSRLHPALPSCCFCRLHLFFSPCLRMSDDVTCMVKGVKFISFSIAFGTSQLDMTRRSKHAAGTLQMDASKACIAATCLPFSESLFAKRQVPVRASTIECRSNTQTKTIIFMIS